MKWKKLGWILGVSLAACAGGTPEPETAPEWTEEEESEELSEVPSAPRDEDGTDPEEETEAAPAPAAEPEFRAGMSVNEAIAAVPQSTQRVNIEQDALAAPLLRTELYEPCGISGSQRFKLRVAIWDGRAVGVDVTTQPKNDKLDACLREQVASVTWADKVKSLNTVEFSY